MLELVRKLIEKLDGAGVRYVHFKSNEHIDQSVEGKTDFDILVDRHDCRSFEAVLLELDFKRFISPPRAAYPGVDDWLGMDPETGAFIHLHTHYQLVTGKAGYKNYVLPWGQIALESRTKDGETGIFFVAPEFELVELYTRIIAKINTINDLRARRRGYSLKGDNLREAQWLWERIDEEKLSVMKARCFGELAEKIPNDLFRKRKFSAAEYRGYRSVMLRLLQNQERAGMERVGWRSLFHTLSIKIMGKIRKLGFLPAYRRKKYCHTGGMLIAFLGVDGSGKTTVTSEIASWLSWKIETSHMSLGVGRKKQSWQFLLRQRIKKMMGKSTEPKGTTKLPSMEPIPVNFRNGRSQRKKLAFAKEVNRDIRRIHGYCLNGGIMVVDRYPQLQFPGIADGPKVNVSYPRLQEKERAALQIAEEIQPDLVFKLMVPVEVSMQRRPEDSAEVLQRKYDILCSLEYPNSRVVEVDATQPLDQELLFIKKKIWEQL